MGKKLVLIITTVTILVVGIVGFYWYAATGFANAIPKAVKGVYEANKEWEFKGINPIDSISNTVTKAIDSVNRKNLNALHSDKDSIISH